MAFLDKMREGFGPQILVGVGIGLATPILFPAVASAARPLAKTLLKSYFTLEHFMKESVLLHEELRKQTVSLAQAS